MQILQCAADFVCNLASSSVLTSPFLSSTIHEPGRLLFLPRPESQRQNLVQVIQHQEKIAVVWIRSGYSAQRENVWMT